MDNYIELFIEKSKTDKYRQGAKVFISAEGENSGIKICLFNYFSLAGIAEESCDFIFRHIIRMRSGFKLDKKKRLTYCRDREVLLDRLTEMGLDKKLFGLHSLRSGGATAAASNASVCDRLIMKHGRWVTEKSKNLYIHENLASKLSVTKNMN